MNIYKNQWWSRKSSSHFLWRNRRCTLYHGRTDDRRRRWGVHRSSCCQHTQWSGIVGAEHREVCIRRGCESIRWEIRTGSVNSLSLRDFQPRRQLLLPLRSSILEPGFYLYFGQIQALRQLHPLADAQIFVLLKFVLESLELLRAIRLPRLPVHTWLSRPFPRRLGTCASIEINAIASDPFQNNKINHLIWEREREKY